MHWEVSKRSQRCTANHHHDSAIDQYTSMQSDYLKTQTKAPKSYQLQNKQTLTSCPLQACDSNYSRTVGLRLASPEFTIRASRHLHIESGRDEACRATTYAVGKHTLDCCEDSCPPSRPRSSLG